MKRIIAAIIAAMLLLALTACVGGNKPSTQGAASNTDTPVASSSEPQRLSYGEPFETTISLEGMEEPVMAQNVVSSLGYTMDYFCEDFTIEPGKTSDLFRWNYDAAELPQNAMIVTRRTESADTAAAAMKTELEGKYVSVEQGVYDLGGEVCAALYASDAKEGSGLPAWTYCNVFVLPAGEGCLVVEQRYAYEAADGIGARVYAMLATLGVID